MVGQQHHDDVVFAEALRDAERRGDRHARRSADQKALFASETAGHGEALGVGHPFVAIDDRGVERVGVEVFADALHRVGVDRAAGVDRALGVGAHDDGLARRGILQKTARAADRAARADAGDEVGDAPVGVAPDLGPGRLVVRARTVRVRELVGLERAGDLAREPVRHAVVRVGVVGRHVRGHLDDLGAVRAEHRRLLSRELVGHDEDHAVPALQGDQGEPDAGVAAGRFDDRAAGAEGAGCLGGIDDPRGDAVFRRPAGVEVFNFREHRRAGARSDVVQSDERGVSDEVGDVRDVTHEGVLWWGRGAGEKSRKGAWKAAGCRGRREEPGRLSDNSDRSATRPHRNPRRPDASKCYADSVTLRRPP